MRGMLATRPRIPLIAQATITTTTPEVMVAAVAEQRTVLYHISLSNSESSLATATLKFGTTTRFKWHIPADGGNILCNFYGTELCTDFNESISVTLSANGGVDVTVCYIQS